MSNSMSCHDMNYRNMTDRDMRYHGSTVNLRSNELRDHNMNSINMKSRDKLRGSIVSVFELNIRYSKLSDRDW